MIYALLFVVGFFGMILSAWTFLRYVDDERRNEPVVWSFITFLLCAILCAGSFGAIVRSL